MARSVAEHSVAERFAVERCVAAGHFVAVPAAVERYVAAGRFVAAPAVVERCVAAGHFVAVPAVAAPFVAEHCAAALAVAAEYWPVDYFFAEYLAAQYRVVAWSAAAGYRPAECSSARRFVARCFQVICSAAGQCLVAAISKYGLPQATASRSCVHAAWALPGAVGRSLTLEPNAWLSGRAYSGRYFASLSGNVLLRLMRTCFPIHCDCFDPREPARRACRWH
jgi:hypothetical protein